MPRDGRQAAPAGALHKVARHLGGSGACAIADNRPACRAGRARAPVARSSGWNTGRSSRSAVFSEQKACSTPLRVSPGDPLGNHGQRPIPLAVVFEPVLSAAVARTHPYRPRARGSRRSSALRRDRKRAPLSNSPAKIRTRRCKARLASPWARCCSLSASPLMIRSRLRPKGGPP